MTSAIFFNRYGDFLIALIPFAFGAYGLFRTQGWKKPLVWVYFLLSPFFSLLFAVFLSFFGTLLPAPLPALPEVPLVFFAWSGVLLIHLASILFALENPVTIKDIFFLLLFYPLVLDIFGRTGVYIIYRIAN